MKTIKIPKDAVMMHIKSEVSKGLTAEFKKLGRKHFKFVDMEWEPDGLTIYYTDSPTKVDKAKGK